MGWICLEGLDRTGKSTVAAFYKKQGFEVVHLSAPDKKYTEDGYTGPSYLDDLLDLIMQYDGKDVVFDRTWYGEFVWPHVYGRKPLLSEEDIEVIQDYEYRNSATRILMVDPDTEAHWKRCVDNNEPLERRQFNSANSLFNRLAHRYEFIPRELSSFSIEDTQDERERETQADESKGSKPSDTQRATPAVSDREGEATNGGLNAAGSSSVREEDKTPEQKTLEKANAINSILSRRIIKQKGGIFDQIERDLKNFLNDQLKEIFSGKNNEYDSLSEEEILVLKIYAKKILEKQKGLS